VNLLHGGRSWKQQRPFMDKPRDDDDNSTFASKNEKWYRII